MCGCGGVRFELSHPKEKACFPVEMYGSKPHLLLVISLSKVRLVAAFLALLSGYKLYKQKCRSDTRNATCKLLLVRTKRNENTKREAKHRPKISYISG